MPTQERQCKICTFKYAYGRGITTAQILTIPIERVILVDDSMYLLQGSPNCSSSAKLLNRLDNVTIFNSTTISTLIPL